MNPVLGCILLPIFAYWSIRDLKRATVKFVHNVRRKP